MRASSQWKDYIKHVYKEDDTYLATNGWWWHPSISDTDRSIWQAELSLGCYQLECTVVADASTCSHSFFGDTVERY